MQFAWMWLRLLWGVVVVVVVVVIVVVLVVVFVVVVVVAAAAVDVAVAAAVAAAAAAAAAAATCYHRYRNGTCHCYGIRDLRPPKSVEHAGSQLSLPMLLVHNVLFVAARRRDLQLLERPKFLLTILCWGFLIIPIA